MRKLLVIALLVLLLLISCSEKTISDSRFVLGTLCYIELHGTDDDEILQGAFSLLYDIDSRISRYDEGSYIAKINSNAGISPVAVPDDIYNLIKRTLEFAEDTDGIFNPAIGPLSALWGLGTESQHLPSEEEIQAVLPLLDWRNITLDDEAMTVYLHIPGMALDLGGAGKGWASDLVRDYLLEEGVENALINLGGNIVAMGRIEGRPWTIGIQTPGEPSGAYFERVSAEDESIVTSGGYQRYFVSNGKTYHHILSSSTGYPAETDLISATAIGDDGLLLDMLSTAMFASGSDEAAALAGKYGIRAILLTDDLSIIDTSGT